MDRCVLFVDAGYLLADGAMAVHGTRHRETVSWDFGGLLQLLGNLARERTSMPLLRCYWYEATVEGRRAPEHEALADLPGLKLRLGRVRPGRREGVDTEIHRDLMTLARNGAVADAIVVSGDEDLARVISDAQDLGVRVTVVHVAVDGNWTISRVLRQECDDLIEIGSSHLRPYVNLLGGMNGMSGMNGMNGMDTSSSPLSNGHATSSGNSMASLQNGSLSSPPPGSPISGQLPQLSAPMSTPSMNSSLNSSMTSGNGSQNSSMGIGGPTYSAPPPMSSAPSYLMPPSSPPQQQPLSQQGPYTAPQQMPPAPVQQPTPTLSDAVKAAHKEGQDFGESVARDAPALWLEAVLARKPRMPSDLEARLLQGSSLPIDFLLHDEVRHALRRGFWDALERSRR